MATTFRHHALADSGLAEACTGPRAGPCGCGLIGTRRDRLRLLDRATGRTIGDIRAREFECPPAVVAAAGVELRGMVRESEQVSVKKLFKAGSGVVELCLGHCE